MSKYIVLEGADGLGKSSQIEHIVEYLTRKKHEECVAIREPGITPRQPDSFSEQLRRVLLNTPDLSKEEELSLLDTTRLYNTRKYIIPALQDDVYILSDRNFISSLVYQTLPMSASKLYMDKVKAHVAEGRLKLPDLVLFFTLDDGDDVSPIVERIKHRTDNNRLDTDKAIEIQNRIRDYNYIVRQYIEPICKVVTIKANRPIEQVTADVLKAIEDHT